MCSNSIIVLGTTLNSYSVVQDTMVKLRPCYIFEHVSGGKIPARKVDDSSLGDIMTWLALMGTCTSGVENNNNNELL